MGRPLKSKFYPLALSPTMAATQLSIPVRRVRAALNAGELEAFADGPRVRILTVDLLEWVRKWPRAAIRKKLREMS